MSSNDRNGTKGKFSATIKGSLVNLKANLFGESETRTIHGTTKDDRSDKYYVLRIDFPSTFTGSSAFGKNKVNCLALLMGHDGLSSAGGWITGGNFTLTSSDSKTAHFKGTFHGVASSEEDDLDIEDGIFDLQGISQNAAPEVAELTRHQKQTAPR
jgi:hypothetical protein